MDLKDRLEKIESLKRKVQQVNNNYQKSSSSYWQARTPLSISEVITGNLMATPYGPCFFTEKNIPLESSFGELSLLDMVNYFPSGLDLWIPKFKEENNDFQLEDILFFDTETTGLAGGSGTYIFLLGLGYFKEDSFWVRQYFMSDYHEEEALLWAVNQFFAQGFKLLVSYNGKSYDYPLLQTRYIMMRLPLQLNTTYHLDLLFPTRRLWKRRLQDCSLPHIEKKILNIYREEDLPGYLIPQVYFRYLQDKDARPLKTVFAHNLQDIVSLAILTARIGQIFQDQDPLRRVRFGQDLFSMGKIYEGNKDFQYSSKCYEEALNGNLSEEESLEALKLCSFAYKRQGEWKKAEQAWCDLISLSRGNRKFIFYPYEELAKYYEHILKDYWQAERIVEEALFRLGQESIKEENKKQWQQALHHRLKRIKRKQKIIRSI